MIKLTKAALTAFVLEPDKLEHFRRHGKVLVYPKQPGELITSLKTPKQNTFYRYRHLSVSVCSRQSQSSAIGRARGRRHVTTAAAAAADDDILTA